MSQENLHIVERAIAAMNARDIDGYLACCTEDVELRTPMAPVGGVVSVLFDREEALKAVGLAE